MTALHRVLYLLSGMFLFAAPLIWSVGKWGTVVCLAAGAIAVMEAATGF